MLIGLILIISCSATPYHIAFYKYSESIGVWKGINMFFDISFAIDIIVSFVSSSYDEDFYVVDDLKIIAYKYITSWFLIDLVAIFPFHIL